MKLSELLQEMHDKINLLAEDGGLCRLKYYIFGVNTKKEEIVHNYLESNIPFTWYSLFQMSPYWWKPGLIKPRKKWLEKHIKKLQKKGL